MLQNLKISQRLNILLLVQALIIVGIAGVSVAGLNVALESMQTLNRNAVEGINLTDTLAQALSTNRSFLFVTSLISVVGLVISASLGTVIVRSIRDSIAALTRTVGEVTAGDYTVRCELAGEDELAMLGNALDRLLDERVSALARAESENEQLNDSVLELLEAVDELSQRNLTVEVPVHPDVTGPVADAINKMAEEFTRVLRQVASIAQRVVTACTNVNDRAIAVSRVAEAQLQDVQRTAAQLENASKTLTHIAETARQCSHHADETAATTGAAMEAVDGTLGGMRQIRDSIEETSNRIKRLGDRSQEITGIVDLISGIAERTRMLALNASMQAASAGEAGRGFAVVADEVQRLAESSREATRQIGQLVKNIQVDTSDTIVTMSRTVTQVVEGTRLAESATMQMSNTRDSTAELVDLVKQIAANSQQQSRISTALKARSGSIVSHSMSTSSEISEQLKQTETLVQYSQVLNKAVRAFRLSSPAAE